MKEFFEIKDSTLVRYHGLERRIVIPEEVTEIGIGAFSNCHTAEEILLHDGIRTVGNHAFGGCRALREMILPDSVTELGEYTFQYCDSLKKITFPKGLKHIRDGVFRHCTALEELTLPEGLESVGYETFYGCSQLRRILLHGKEFGRSMLDGCFRLTYFDGPLAALVRLDRDAADIVSMEYSRHWGEGIYSETADRAYAEFLTDVSHGIMQYIAENDDVKALYYFVEQGAISEQSADTFIGLAQQNDAFRVVSTLMEYRNRHFGEDGLDLIDQTFDL